MSKRIQYQVSGEVQGVNYRSFAAKEAGKLSLTGYVQNESDGTVSGEAQGDKDALEQFVGQLKKGPSIAKVTGLEQKDISTKSGETGYARR